MPFCRSLCPCTFSKHLQFSYKFSQGGKNGNKSTKIKSWMKCFVIFRLDCMSSYLSRSVNQSQRIIVWFAMIPPLQTFSQLFWIHHQNKGPREMYNINQFESKLVCIVISEHEFTQGFQSCLEWKSEKKTHFTTLIEAGAHQQPEKVKIHQFHPEETWAPLITAEGLRFDQY